MAYHHYHHHHFNPVHPANPMNPIYHRHHNKTNEVHKTYTEVDSTLVREVTLSDEEVQYSGLALVVLVCFSIVLVWLLTRNLR